MNSDTARYDRLYRVGHAIHGDDWQSPMARSLGITGRHLRRWVAGKCTVPAWVDGRLAGILQEAATESASRAHALESLAGSLPALEGVA